MQKFIVLNDDYTINNIIVSESQEIAENVTGLRCIQVNPDDDLGTDGWWDGTKIRSFVDSPPSKPEDGYVWNEGTKSWIDPIL